MSLPSTPKGQTGSDEWLYEVFRCGFIHGYPDGNVAWARTEPSSYYKYWFHHRGRLTLNIDKLVRGFHRGIEEFRRLADTDTVLRSRFIDFIVA